MTVQQTSQYTCDRCHEMEIVPLDSVGPPAHRMAGPTGWTALRIGTDPSTPLSHLCKACGATFADFMAVRIG